MWWWAGFCVVFCGSTLFGSMLWALLNPRTDDQ